MSSFGPWAPRLIGGFSSWVGGGGGKTPILAFSSGFGWGTSMMIGSWSTKPLSGMSSKGMASLDLASRWRETCSSSANGDGGQRRPDLRCGSVLE